MVKNLSVVVVSWNTRELLRSCLTSLQDELSKMLAISSEVIVVDNASSDGSAEMVAEHFPEVILIANPDNKGFGRANNQAFKIASGDYILLLNPDTVVVPGSITSLRSYLQNNPDVGIVAPQLINTDGTIQRSCREFPTLSNLFYEMVGLSKLFPNNQVFNSYKMNNFDHQSLQEVDQPEGACLLIRKSVLDQVGLFDEKFFMLFEEVDLCYRIKKAGWKIIFNPESKIVHHYGQSIKQVKAKMIISSHRGMYIYWTKHNRSFLSRLFRPVLAVSLMLLAIIRIILYIFKKLYEKYS